ncbi:MAG TPA: MerR family transcriptional regulator [Acidimicrobiales bacterium]|nr:MerR family transcriptional regulator [Acidimicrobiales bacterium]
MTERKNAIGKRMAAEGIEWRTKDCQGRLGGRDSLTLSELSARSERSVATIKYYLREGLLPAGRRTSANRADYGEEHLHRLRVITTLVDTGGLPIATVSAVLEAVDDQDISMHEVLGVAHYGLSVRLTDDAASAPATEAKAEVDRFLDDLGWRVKPDAPAKRELAGALPSLRQLGWNVGADVFSPYARAADELAAWELAYTPSSESRGRMVEAVLVALRRLAKEHHSAARLGSSNYGRPAWGLSPQRSPVPLMM